MYSLELSGVRPETLKWTLNLIEFNLPRTSQLHVGISLLAISGQNVGELFSENLIKLSK
jgi:hypothetical protein